MYLRIWYNLLERVSYMNDRRLILASASPRRRELFELLGLKFEAIASDADENIPACPPGQMVELLAARKAQQVYDAHPNCCVVGSDTIVVLGGEIIGKPADEADAFRILSSLSGQTHTVYTGVCILTENKEIRFHDATDVTFASMDAEEIQAYIRTGEPMDKAGAYGIQGFGALLVERVEGCYFTVMGMPVQKLYRALKSIGIRPEWMS